MVLGESSAHMLKSPGMTGVGIKKKTEWLITVSCAGNEEERPRS